MKVTQLSIDTLKRAQERFEDTLEQISGLNDSEPLWESAGWTEKFSLDLPDDTEDWKHTPEEAEKVSVTDRQLLLGYLTASVDFAIAYLNAVEEEQLGDIVDTNWTPPVTREVRLVSAIDDAVMHSGQAVYTRRLVIGK